jgi:flagellar hook-associated protein 2
VAASIGSLGNTVNITGLASGLDTSSIIAGLTQLNTQHIQDLQAQKAVITQKQSVFSDLGTKLSTLQDAASQLARSVSGAFDTTTAVSSDTNYVDAASSTTAASGVYSITVQTLAKAQQLASQGFADAGTNIKQGTLTLQLGAGTATTVTINSSNNTLQGLADAINAASTDVRASIVNDGTATPYRLLLTASRSGAANTIQVTNNLTNGDGATIDPTNTTVQAAADASVRVGSGAGAVTVTSPTNRLDKLIPGVTLNLKQADPTKPITITVGPDVSSAGDAVQGFVDSYNAVVDFVGSHSGYNASTQQAGELLGNFDVDGLMRDLGISLGASVPSVNSSVNRGSTVGLSFDDAGHLQFDRSKLESVLSGNVPGASANDVKRLFALTGASSASGVRFLLGGAKTKTSDATPYQVDVTQAATHGSASGTNDLAATTVIDNTNNSFTIKIDGRQSATLTVAAGSYTRSQLAAAVQSAINADTTLGNSQVVADLDGNKLRISSQGYGSSSQVAIGTGSAVTSGALGFAGAEAGSGLNVAGTFIVNGVVETAVGTGQVLTGNSGNAHTDGLQVMVTLTPAQVVSGPDASLTVTRGLADGLGQVLSRYLDPVSGRLKTINKELSSQSDDIDQTITKQNDLLDQKKQELIDQFNAMETAISQINTLGQQISAVFAPPTATTTSTTRL